MPKRSMSMRQMRKLYNEMRDQVIKEQRAANELRGKLAEASADLAMMRDSLFASKLLLARLQGYVERIHLLEGITEPPAPTSTDEAILDLRNQLANGTPERAKRILDLIHPSELLDRITGKDDDDPFVL